jgi:purine-binding chemotaxis protein CheW
MSKVLERQYLTFTIAEERFALAVGRVREVLEYSQITRLPGQLAYLKGLIDLRGKGVPVIDLRIRFDISEIGMTRDSAIIVAELGGGDDMKVIGLLVDAVHEVIEVDPAGIDEPPSFGSRTSDLFLKGIAKKDRAFILILDADRLLKASDLDSISGAAVGEGEPIARLA